ncbi:MAG: hypothetical protein LC733_13730, partial [Actinobacteria bacterium]|nr:hypothetical protein [Actinomycetota bacterium]
LPTLTYYPIDGMVGAPPTPSAPGARARGPFPLIVFAHGSGVMSPSRYELLFRFWVAAGYVVVAPSFPLSSDPALERGSRDVLNQPADVSFLISEMLRLNRDPTSAYAGLIDPDRIGVGGHSLGGVTALGVAFNSCCLDARIKAGFVLAGLEQEFPGGTFFPGDPGTPTPLLVVHGDDDVVVHYPDGRKVFDDAPPPKAMLTVVGGDHNVPFAGGPSQDFDKSSGQPNEETGVVITGTLGFLDRYLKGSRNALEQAEDKLPGALIARLEIVEG